MIQRYSLCRPQDGPDRMCKSYTGNYVSYEDHLAALAEKEAEISYLKEWKAEAEKELIRCGQTVAEMDNALADQAKEIERLKAQLDALI